MQTLLLVVDGRLGKNGHPERNHLWLCVVVIAYLDVVNDDEQGLDVSTAPLVTLAHRVQVIVDNYWHELQGELTQLDDTRLVEAVELVADLVGQLRRDKIYIAWEEVLERELYNNTPPL